ncbi:hypothetical protein LSCM1_05457 [Leishmania martiniquensis]|uniref:Uncharacterized protein n=1 Tax=Leishmania martiniquensis TaxID=1580590 RepID=A0A836HHU3_9TRYP|nr:hypothetical protein LSCM1_05457 [Leishmania martiniquensis]
MPPRRKSASGSKSRSASKSSRKSSPRPSGREPAKSPSLPPPDPAAVQRLVDEAIARARERRASNDVTAQRTSISASSHQPVLERCVTHLFSAGVSEKMTDIAKAFLVTCITVYFTWVGYAFYREWTAKQ